jgi:hypothetical protein
MGMIFIIIKSKNQLAGQLMLIIPATGEAEAGKSLFEVGPDKSSQPYLKNKIKVKGVEVCVF